jgi:hypothetical protein
MPHIKGGDEPHYLLILNSLMNDGDLDLKNNYESVHQGSLQAGRKFAGSPLDHQVTWVIDGKRIGWGDIYQTGGEWNRDSQGHPVPTLKPGITMDVSSLPQYSGHPPGEAFLLAPFLWPFRGTRFVEPLALLASNFMVILSVFLFRSLIARYIPNRLILNYTTLLVFLGTPVWNVGRTLFTESFLLCFALAAYVWALRKNSGFWPGVFIGMGILMKPVFILLLPPILWSLWTRKLRREMFLALTGPLFSTGVTLLLNDRMFGSPWNAPQPFTFGNPLVGILGLLFSWNHGLFTFAPIALLAVLSWRRFHVEQNHEALLFALGFAGYFLVMASWNCWWGGWCYGPRLIAPVIPFLMIPCFYTLESYPKFTQPVRLLVLLLCVLSLAFNFLGALDGYWDSHPLTILWGNIS